jgi:hypothetical protein
LTGHKSNDILPVSLRHQGIFFIGSVVSASGPISLASYIRPKASRGYGSPLAH